MQLTITREVIQSIKFARDFQLAQDPAPPDKAALAKLGFNNGHRAELILNIKKLSAWARTFKADQVPDGFKTVIEEPDSHYAGSLMLRADLGNEFSSLLRLHAGGLVFADPIEVEIKDGVAQIVAAPGGETELKAIRAAARLESGRQRNAKERSRIEEKLRGASDILERKTEHYDQSTFWLTEHSLSDALINAKLRRDQERVYRQIRAEFDDCLDVKDKLLALGLLERPEEVSTVDWDGQEATIGQSPLVTYDSLWAEFLKLKAKHDTYAPTKSWGKHASDERRRRADKMTRAKSRLWSLVHNELYVWCKGARDQEVSSYQAHRVTVRRWPSERTSLEAEIAGFQQELVLKQEQLTRLENPVKPVKTPKAKRQPVSIQPVPGIQDSQGETMSKTAERLDLIERIIQAARKPVPKIVESRELLGTDGKWYRGDMPIGVDYANEVRVTGYVFQDPDGTRYGVRAATEQELTARFNTGQDADMQRFREGLTNYSDDRLQSQADYWLGTETESSEIQPEPTPVPQQTGEIIMPDNDSIILTFTKEKETKNTIKFEEDERDGQPKIVGSLYLQKFVAKSRDKITVTIA